MLHLKDFVKNNTVQFSHYRKGYFYYNVKSLDVMYVFPVPLDDLGDSTLLSTDNAMFFMRYIRKAREEGTLVKC